jgi:hypothetical protein
MLPASFALAKHRPTYSSETGQRAGFHTVGLTGSVTPTPWLEDGADGRVVAE